MAYLGAGAVTSSDPRADRLAGLFPATTDRAVFDHLRVVHDGGDDPDDMGGDDDGFFGGADGFGLNA